MRELERFDSSYLALRYGSSDRVAEMPENRYLPQRPVPVSEHLIQLLWRNGLYNKTGLKTTNGLPVKIIKPGRLNKGAGPDFKNARVAVEGREKTGDVEIHINANGWYEHNHHLSPLYNSTILHVFLHRTENSRPAVSKNGKVIPELELGLYLRHRLDEIQTELEEADSPTTGRTETPPCKKYLQNRELLNINHLLDLVGDGRMLIKSNLLIDRMKTVSQRQLLYEIFFECLGFSRFKKNFGELARQIPSKTLREIIAENPGIPPAITAQAVFFKASGLIDTANKTADDAELKKILHALEGVRLNGIEKIFTLADWPLGGCRPANFPHRRIAAFSHLAVNRCDSDKQLEAIASLPLDPSAREAKGIIRKLLAGFTEASDLFWNRRYTFNRSTRLPKKLIGKDRAVSLVVDGLIPFCLAISRKENDLELEHKLVTIYRMVPKPSSNAVIDFMKRNLFDKKSGYTVKSVRHQQALIQLYKDFCFTAPAGCDKCALLELLKLAV